MSHSSDRQGAYLEFLDGWFPITLAVKVVRIESLDGMKHLVVLLVHEVAVGPLLVPRVEAVVSDHGESIVRKGGLLFHNVVEVLIMTPGEHDTVEAAA